MTNKLEKGIRILTGLRFVCNSIRCVFLSGKTVQTFSCAIVIIIYDFTKEDLEEALRALSSLLHKCEKVQKSKSLGSSQRTLLKNRIRAFQVAMSLITKSLAEK